MGRGTRYAWCVVRTHQAASTITEHIIPGLLGYHPRQGTPFGASRPMPQAAPICSRQLRAHDTYPLAPGFLSPVVRGLGARVEPDASVGVEPPIPPHHLPNGVCAHRSRRGGCSPMLVIIGATQAIVAGYYQQVNNSSRRQYGDCSRKSKDQRQARDLRLGHVRLGQLGLQHHGRHRFPRPVPGFPGRRGRRSPARTAWRASWASPSRRIHFSLTASPSRSGCRCSSCPSWAPSRIIPTAASR